MSNSTLKELLERDREKISENLKRRKPNDDVAPEIVLLAEFGLFFGWEAVQAVRNDEISYSLMHELVKGARKISSNQRYNEIVGIYTAVAATTNSKGLKALKELLESLK